jgi:hypothetical protein
MLTNQQIESIIDRPIKTSEFGTSYIFKDEAIYSQRSQKIKSMLVPKKALNTKFINYGGYNDGGYVLADDIRQDDGLISLGVENNINFEKSLESTIQFVHTYDFSVNGVPQKLKNNTFFKEKIGFSGSENTDLKKILSRVGDHENLLLKMDIELGEYPFLLEADSSDLNRFRQIVVEFHELIGLKDANIYEIINRSLEKITQTHTAVWVHGNNGSPLTVIGNHAIPSVVEVLFLRNSTYEFVPYQNEYAETFIKLRGPNHGGAEDIRLNFGDL